MQPSRRVYRTKARRSRSDRGVLSGPHTPVLAVDAAGLPVGWMRWQKAVYHLLAGDVTWSLGQADTVIYGGTNRHGERSRFRGRCSMQSPRVSERSMLEIPPIIAIRGEDASGLLGVTPALTAEALFARDRHLCLYCGERFIARQLTRDHVRPVSRGGANAWGNVVAACKPCNNRKADRTPDEAHMPLLAVPYAPNHAESLILLNRRILADQMEFLASQVPSARAGRYLSWQAEG